MCPQVDGSGMKLQMLGSSYIQGKIEGIAPQKKGTHIHVTPCECGKIESREKWLEGKYMV